MCGRYGFVPGQNFDERFGVENRQESLFPQYNIAPGASMPVVVRNSPNQIALMRWGLIPHWSKEPRVKFSTINARAETITTSPAYRAPFRSRSSIEVLAGNASKRSNSSSASCRAAENSRPLSPCRTRSARQAP